MEFINFPLGIEFQEYLDKSGALDAIAEVLENIRNQPEWPKNPTHEIRKHLASMCGLSPDPLVELIEVQNKLAALKKEKKKLRRKLAKKQTKEREARKKEENAYTSRCHNRC